MGHRNESIRVFTRRGELPAGSPPSVPDRSFLRRLKGVDPNLEMYWHPVLQVWICYRLARKGASPASDCLAAVGPVPIMNEAYIYWLQKNDIFRKYRAEGKRAAELQDQMLEKQEYERKRTADREMDHFIDEVKRDAWNSNMNKLTTSNDLYKAHNKKLDEGKK
jgi:hypothetical protein